MRVGKDTEDEWKSEINSRNGGWRTRKTGSVELFTFQSPTMNPRLPLD